MGLFDQLFGDIAAGNAYNNAVEDMKRQLRGERSSAPSSLIQKVIEARVYASAARRLENNQSLSMSPIEDGTLCVVNAMESLGISNYELTEVSHALGLNVNEIMFGSLEKAAHVAGEKATVAANEAGVQGYPNAKKELVQAAAYFMQAELGL